jgi:hypothetical protein
MTKKKIGVFGAAGVTALLIGFVLFDYNFTHNFHIAISDQQASDIETALKGSLGEAIFSGQPAKVIADSTIESKSGLDALLTHDPSDIQGQGLIEAYQKDPQKFRRYAQMLDTAVNAKQVIDAIIRGNLVHSVLTSESLAIDANHKVDAWGKPFCIIPIGKRFAVVSGGPSRLSCDALPLTPEQIGNSNRTMFAGPSDVVVVIAVPSQHSAK